LGILPEKEPINFLQYILQRKKAENDESNTICVDEDLKTEQKHKAFTPTVVSAIIIFSCNEKEIHCSKNLASTSKKDRAGFLKPFFHRKSHIKIIFF
jgi:hypothetical protein